MDSTTTKQAPQTTIPPILKEWLTPHELEETFNIKMSTQNKMRMAKTLPHSKVGKFIRYSRTRINQMFADAEVV